MVNHSFHVKATGLYVNNQHPQDTWQNYNITLYGIKTGLVIAPM